MLMLCAMMAVCPVFAQGINDKADNIVGEYLTDRGGSKSKVRITKTHRAPTMHRYFGLKIPLTRKARSARM